MEHHRSFVCAHPRAPRCALAEMQGAGCAHSWTFRRALRRGSIMALVRGRILTCAVGIANVCGQLAPPPDPSTACWAQAWLLKCAFPQGSSALPMSGDRVLAGAEVEVLDESDSTPGRQGPDNTTLLLLCVAWIVVIGDSLSSTSEASIWCGSAPQIWCSMPCNRA